MDIKLIKDFSARLKDTAKDLSFLGHPRFPKNDLMLLFPEHKDFIDVIEDISVPFPVNVDEKKRSIDQFLKDLSTAELSSEMREIFTQRIQEYHLLITMLENFGTPFFYDNCVKLYGSSHKLSKNVAFPYVLERIPHFCLPDQSGHTYQGEEALDYLRGKMGETFSSEDFDVKPSNSLLSDSSAGRKVLKLNPHKSYTTGHLNIFLVHEGWVHLGTSLNGAAQEDHPWLSTWAPGTTIMQEGLAILTELITGYMTLERWNKVLVRHLATTMAERGSEIRDVYSYLRHQRMEELDAFKLALRVFRGVPLEGGMAFTKELLYLHGLINLLSHLRFFKADLRSLWCGKMSFEEHVTLLDNWSEFNPALKFFPSELDSPYVQNRLKKLQDIVHSLLRHD